MVDSGVTLPTPGTRARCRSRCCGPGARGGRRRPAARRSRCRGRAGCRACGGSIRGAGSDMKERESVSMPTKRESRPTLESALSCHSIPSFWSRNHQPLPNWILPGDRAVLEVADHRRERVVVGGVEVVDDHLRQRVLAVEPVEVATERLDLRPVADRVDAGVGAERLQARRVVVAERAEVELLGPALLPRRAGRSSSIR